MAIGAVEAFRDLFPDSRDVQVVRAPGRVNIIGEHTDYNGLPVLPMAIDREIVIAFERTGNPGVEIANVDDSYPSVGFDLSADIEHYETGHWGNYVKAAGQAVWHWAAEHHPGAVPLFGIRGVVAGDIPQGAGLSSSSALVVAAACALIAANGLHIPKPELADLLASGERYVGTQGGGMDQAVTIMAEKNYALKIDFSPLRVRPIPLPRGYVIVVANSMVPANKTGAARVAFNTRVAECKLGLEMLKSHVRQRHPEIGNAALLRDFALAVPDWRAAVGHLPEMPMTLAEIADYSRISVDELGAKCLVQQDGTLLGEPESGFEPRKRCRHVLSEGQRVELAADAMEQGDAEALGRLMNESHASCASDYEISCPELDDLVRVMRRHGALGARLTGAGFGGCAVALVKEAESAAFTNNVWWSYYENGARERADGRNRDDILFACSPSDGAGLIT